MPEHTGNNYCENLGNNLVWIITWIDDTITFIFSLTPLRISNIQGHKPKIRDSVYLGLFY
jgi:hypothetical protein